MRVVIDAGEIVGEKKPEGQEEAEGEAEGVEAEAEVEAEEERTLVDELASFLSQRLGREVKVSGSELSVDVEGPSEKRRVKQLLKKFLYKWELEDDFRVISLGEGVFRIKKRRFPRLRKSTWA